MRRAYKLVFAPLASIRDSSKANESRENAQKEINALAEQGWSIIAVNTDDGDVLFTLERLERHSATIDRL